jgi:hypothetical protein
MLDYSTFKEIHALFMKGHVAEAQRILMELQARYITLCDELSALQKQVQEFEDILFLAQNLITEEEQYWLRTGGVKHGPFCKLCYDYTGKLIRLESHKNAWRCPYCGVLHSREPASGTVLAVNGPPTRQGKIIPFSFAAKHC